MTASPRWNPRDPEVLDDPISAYDQMRQRCPVAHSDYLHYSVFRHADAMRILLDPTTFSSQASHHVSVPNSMDPPQHTAYRALIDPYFRPARIAEFAPACRRICAELVGALPRHGLSDVMTDLAHPFAVRVQCAFLGWPDSLRTPLRQWVHDKNAATLSGDPRATRAVATQFDDTIRALIMLRRQEGAQGPVDVTHRLTQERVNGRPLRDEEIVSILRNWTVGELGTLASSVGIIAYYLAQHPDIQALLRRRPELIRAANDEILRIHAPLIANRRTPTRPVELGGVPIQPGERITLIWASANRDEAVFGDPDEFRLDRDPALNLLYGAGIHICPGASLARLELEIMTRTLLAHTLHLEPDHNEPPLPAHYPASGYSRAVLRVSREALAEID